MNAEILTFQELGCQVLPHLASSESSDVRRVSLLRRPLPVAHDLRLRLHGLDVQLVASNFERRLVLCRPTAFHFTHPRW